MEGITRRRLNRIHLMEQYFSLERGKVYWNLRLGNGPWIKERTLHTKLPVYSET